MTKHYREITAEVSANLAKLLAYAPELTRGFGDLSRAAMASGPDTALDTKTKELIAMVLAVVARCDRCRCLPTQVNDASGAPFTDVAQVNVGGWLTIALKTDGSVWGRGRSLERKLATGDFTNAINPVLARAAAGGSLAGVTAVVAGFAHVLALKSDPTVLARGE